MPLGIQRLNAKKSQPNDRIIFIKPLPGPHEAIAQDFLERIAAQCVPIMRQHHLSITSLEEFPPNREFVGRNFNAGEVIQLVLKTRSGAWLPFNYVQMVMMHELAHNKQMNHSKAFWQVRNQFADEMRALWQRKFTGEGLWGRGALLSTGEWERNSVGEGEELPEHLCGGTYRSRRGGRKRKVKVDWREQRERRILKKFGAGGEKLGEDEEVKKELEGGKKVKGKPRVAGSGRGRELRAAAALARLEQGRKGGGDVKKEEEEETDSGDDYEDDVSLGPDAVDFDGRKLLDGKGQGMVKVCEDENPDDQDVQDELRELRSFGRVKKEPGTASSTLSTLKPSAKKQGTPSEKKAPIPKLPPPNPKGQAELSKTQPPNPKAGHSTPLKVEPSAPFSTTTTTTTTRPTTCPTCSFDNEPISAICAVCSNVLNPARVPNSWACTSSTCTGTTYRNAGDVGLCGVCGTRKPQAIGLD
ncbi:WLM domain-containing protein [Cercophora samala]|uniref:WLM domain-containing protein n=1 Tax=Cercophora samala TaxID=330535 RepID=A0AA39ZLL3_9PEZI|nr:WLM domain-containing protein [Cercophora samala]